MFLSFATAALIVGVQTAGLFANQATASSTPTSTAVPASTASPAAERSASAHSAAVRSVPKPVQIGIKKTVSSALHPTALIQQPQLVVDLSDRQVSLYQNGLLQVSYSIAVGQVGWETPSGNFQVLNMQEYPVWQNPITGETVTNSPDNPLGSRWIGFWTDGIHQVGFHGTNQDEFIGQAVSHGCIRMRNSEIEALYSQLTIGTSVLVQP